MIFTLQRLDIITTLENPEPIRLSLRNQVMNSEDDNSAFSDELESDGSDFDNLPAPNGDKVTRKFLHDGVSSKALLAELIKSINHFGAHIIDLDAAVDHVANNVNDQTISTSASISSLLESQNALSQRLTALEPNQASILENQSFIMNLLCKVVAEIDITSNDVPKGEKRRGRIKI